MQIKCDKIIKSYWITKYLYCFSVTLVTFETATFGTGLVSGKIFSPIISA